LTLALGARLGAYEIVDLLGAGGMREVYRARDTRLGREVAIKVLPEGVASGGSLQGSQLRWFQRDGTALTNVGPVDHVWSLRVSPRGESVAAETEDPQRRGNAIWIHDLSRESSPPRRLTFESDDAYPRLSNPAPLTLVLNWTAQLKQ
jgi:hypothetical protein